jgi:Flp pilus assembly protein CpaB
MRRGSTIIIIVGVLLALGTAAIAYVMLGRGAGPPAPVGTVTPEEMVSVVVAVQNIPAYTDIPAEAVDTREIAQSQVTANHLLDPEAVVGQRAARTILRGSFIMQDWIVDPEAVAREGKNASLNITEDREGRPRVAMAFETSLLLGVAGAIQNGDFVDVLISYRFIDREEELAPPAEEGEEEIREPTQILVAQLLLQDIEVYRVGPWLVPTPTPVPEGEEPPEEEAVPAEPEPVRSNVLTLLLTQQDALVVKFARESGATIDLVLRGIDDHTIVSTETVTMEYITARFNITIPIEPMRFVPVSQ